MGIWIKTNEMQDQLKLLKEDFVPYFGDVSVYEL